MFSQNAKFRQTYIEEEVSGDFLEHSCQNLADHLVEEGSNDLGHMWSVNVVDCQLFENELSILLPNIFLNIVIITPRSLSTRYYLWQVSKTAFS